MSKSSSRHKAKDDLSEPLLSSDTLYDSSESKSDKSNKSSALSINNTLSAIHVPSMVDTYPIPQSGDNSTTTTPANELNDLFPSPDPSLPDDEQTKTSSSLDNDINNNQVAEITEVLLRARRDLDDKLAKAHHDAEVVLEKRLDNISRLRPALIWVHIIALLHTIVLLPGAYNDNIYGFGTKYFPDHTILDLLFLNIIRFIIALPDIIYRKNDIRIYILSSIHYWYTVCILILSISKMILLPKDIDNLSLIISTIIFIILSATLVVLTHMFEPLQETEGWIHPIDEEEQLEIKRRKDLREEENKRSLELACRLEGEALRLHQEEDIRRKKAYEYSDKLLIKGRIARYENEHQFKHKELLQIMRPYFWPKGILNRCFVFGSWILLAGSKMCSIFAPLYIGKAVNEIINDHTIPWSSLTIYCSLAFGNVLLRQIQSIVFLRVKQYASIELNSNIFQHLLSLSLTYHHNKKMSTVTRALDRGISSLESIVGYIFTLLLPSCVEAIVVFVIFYTKYNQPYLTTITFIHITLYVIITIQITILRKPARRQARTYDNKYHDIAIEALTNIDTVKTFNQESYELRRYVDAVSQYQGFAISNQISLSILNSLQTGIIQLCLLLAYFQSAAQIINTGTLNIGDMSAIAAYVSALYSPLNFLGSIYDMLVQAIIDSQQLVDLYTIKPEIVDYDNAIDLVLDPTTAPTITFDNVSFIYDENTSHGITNLSFTCQPHTTTALVGKTGAGKSTIARLLLRFYDPQYGRILINNNDIKYVTQESLRRNISVCPQETILFNDTIYNNLIYGSPNATMEHVISACHHADLMQFINSLPLRFNSLVGTSGLKVSGGERSRIAIARALIRSLSTHSFGILIADEMTAAVDVVTEHHIKTRLAELQSKGTTTVIIAHRLSTIQDVDNIIVLDHGTIIEQGSHQVLMAKKGVYYDMWQHQYIDEKQQPSSSSPAVKTSDTKSNDMHESSAGPHGGHGGRGHH